MTWLDVALILAVALLVGAALSILQADGIIVAVWR